MTTEERAFVRWRTKRHEAWQRDEMPFPDPEKAFIAGYRSAAKEARLAALEEAYHIAAQSAEAGIFPGATSAQRAGGQEAAAIANRIRALAERKP